MLHTTRKVVTFNWPSYVSTFTWCEFVFSVCKRKLLEELEGVRCSVVGSYHYTSLAMATLSLKGPSFATNKQSTSHLTCASKRDDQQPQKIKKKQKRKKRRKSFSSKVKYKNNIGQMYESSEIEAIFSLLFRQYLQCMWCYRIRTSRSHPTWCGLLLWERYSGSSNVMSI